MASSSTPKKHKKRACVKNFEPLESNETDYLERWFMGNHESIQGLRRDYSNKAIIAPMFLRMLWLKEENLDEVREALRFQKLEKFVRLSGNVYPNLVKVYLTNMRYNEETIYSQIKGVDICINHKVWLAVAGLRNAGIPVGRSHEVGLEGFNKPQFFRSCLRNQNTESRSYSVGGLSVMPRIFAFIVIWLLTPRGFNHVVLTKEDHMLMYFLMGKIKVIWFSVIKEHVTKIRWKVEFKIPYVVLISHFIDYFEIDTDGEVVELVKAQNEVTTATLDKIGLIKVNDDQWICKVNYDSADEQPIEEEDGDVADADEGHDDPMIDAPPNGYENYFAGFEE